MIIRSTFVLLMLLPILKATGTRDRERREATVAECAARSGECDENKGRPVCGTDDRTYPTRCHLIRAHCSGHDVSLKYRGPCRACKEARLYALKHKSKTPPKFVPRCKPDGTYAPVQCLANTGCWCSDMTGKPIENTSVRIGRPNCREYTRSSTRRSPARHPRPSGSRRACNQVDRAAFNANLIKVFQSEYVRAVGQQYRSIAQGISAHTAASGSAVSSILASAGYTQPAQAHVLEWKFSSLDVNANQVLDKVEFRELKKLVKRAVKPRRCGRAFGKFCDVNRDDRLSRSEWNSCLTLDGINRHMLANNDNRNNSYQVNNSASYPTTNHPNHPNNVNSNKNSNNSDFNNMHSNTNQHTSTIDELDNEASDDAMVNEADDNQHLEYDEDAEYEADEEDDEVDNLSIISAYGWKSVLRQKPETQIKENENESDCLSDQATALEEQRHGNTILYVPECTPDGRYQRVQCYRSTPYCWCVQEDTGKNIPGTSVKDRRPDCDDIYMPLRPMKGCPEPRKTEFLRDLKEFLKTQILTNANLVSSNETWTSEDERLGTLSFVWLDKNKNKLWERKEWKPFRELMMNSKNLRKCGKKMPRYCDANTDKKVTLSEWLNCLQAQKPIVPMTTPKAAHSSEVTLRPSRLIGSNPLEQYLRE